MPWNPSIHPSGLREILEAHLSNVERKWIPGPASDWGSDFLRRFRAEQLDIVCLVAAGEMAESLADGERHGISNYDSDTFVTIETFPRSVEEARQEYYPDGYFDYLRAILHTARQIDPECHLVHLQFFCDRRDCRAQFTLLANHNSFEDGKFCSLPLGLLATEEFFEPGFQMGPPSRSQLLSSARVPPTKSFGWSAFRPFADGRGNGRMEVGHLEESAQIHPSGLREILEAHLALVESLWPPGPAGDWARDILRRLRTGQLENVCLAAAGKMAESLVDGEEHGIGFSESDIFVSVCTFPCGVDEARRRYYPTGYFGRVLSILDTALEVNPGCHFVHIRFFCDRRDSRVQFALIPDKEAAGEYAFCTLPDDFFIEENPGIE